MSKIKNAIISISNKKGLLDFAKKLISLDINIYSTGGTKKKLLENNIKVNDITELTHFPEILDGRVKTLHPHVHAGILAKREEPEHQKTLTEKNIDPIDLVVVNLYPFGEIIAKPNTSLEEAIENIDIGGPTLLRSAAKNYKDVTVVCDPSLYEDVIVEIEQNQSTTLELRQSLAVAAFHHVAKYDTLIDKYLQQTLSQKSIYWQHYPQSKSLRYGENPHQSATLYSEDTTEGTQRPNITNAEILHGKAMSYNNYIDADAAIESVLALEQLNFSKKEQAIKISIIKHSNPCGLATGSTTVQALEKAWEGDITSAFGSVIATNGIIDLVTAEYFSDKFIEILIAPDFEKNALEYLTQKSKNLRLLKLPSLKAGKTKPSEHKKQDLHLKYITGGMLQQEQDEKLLEKFELVTKTSPLISNDDLYHFSYATVKRLKSNAIAIVYEYEPNAFMLMGMGAGQPNRVESLKIALMKAEENIIRLFGKEKVKEIMEKTVLSSDAFFPFADNIEHAQKYHVKQIIQPGGSIRDKEVIEACDKYGISMIFTQTRHFLH